MTDNYHRALETRLFAAREKIEHLQKILKAVQSDPCNWLHLKLQAAIEAEVGPFTGYHSLDDSGL